MTRYITSNAVDQNDVPVVGAQVYVYANGALATLQKANGDPLSNPLTTVENGFFEAFSVEVSGLVLRYYWAGKLRYIEALSSGTAEAALDIQDAKTVTAYTLANSDSYTAIPFNSANDVALTIPAASTAAFETGAWIELWQDGAGAVNIAPADGVILRSHNNLLSTAGVNASCAVRYRGSDVWQVYGNLA